MTATLQFDFLVNKENNTLTVRKEFAANRQLVWDCYTKSELLEQWFAPKPWTAKTKILDFREGGRWLYAMCGPEGEEHWGCMEYQKINPIESYVGVDAFCDSDGNLNEQLPRATWHASFQEVSGNTLVETVVTYPSLNDLETILQMGMQEGLTACLHQLEALLNHQKTQQ
jgi:uncharacterized protein YndB with AHSA1/START domain